MRGLTPVLSKLGETIGSRKMESARLESKLNLNHDIVSTTVAWRRRQHLIFAGYSESEIIQLGDLSKLTNERMNELMHSNNLETT
jgi:hypothetical protein